jgi:Spy/CpxP family protein refolding chaperone
MLQATRLWPAYLVSQRQELGLTDAQVSRLQALTDQQPISAEQRSAILETQDRLAEAFDQSDSTTMVRQAQELGREYGELQAHQFEIAARARSVLTAQQRKLLASQPAACRMSIDGETGPGMMRPGQGPGTAHQMMHH